MRTEPGEEDKGEEEEAREAARITLAVGIYWSSLETESALFTRARHTRRVFHCSCAAAAAATTARGCAGKRYLAVHEQVPYAPGKVLVLQLRVLVGDVLVDPSHLQDMTSIQVPGSRKKRSRSQNKGGSVGKGIKWKEMWIIRLLFG